VSRGQHNGSVLPYSRLSRPGPLLFLPRCSSVALKRLSGTWFIYLTKIKISLRSLTGIHEMAFVCTSVKHEHMLPNYASSLLNDKSDLPNVEHSFLFLRVASCWVYHYNVFGFRQSKLYFSNVFYYYYYIPTKCFGPFGPFSGGIYEYIYTRIYWLLPKELRIRCRKNSSLGSNQYIHSTWRWCVGAETCSGYIIVKVELEVKLRPTVVGPSWCQAPIWDPRTTFLPPWNFL
jgi:hypothetical protein